MTMPRVPRSPCRRAGVPFPTLPFVPRFHQAPWRISHLTDARLPWLGYFRYRKRGLLRDAPSGPMAHNRFTNSNSSLIARRKYV